MQLRIALIGVIYRKVLRLKLGSAATTGRIVNMAAADSMRIQFAFLQAPDLVYAPVEMITIGSILVTKLGWTSLTGLQLMVNTKQ